MPADNTKAVDLSVDGIEVSLRVRRATIGDDMRRSMLSAEATEHPQTDPSDQVVAVIIYPRCMACLVDGQIDGRDAKTLTLQEFIELPYQVGDAWVDAAIELNPGWKLTGASEEQETTAKKKD